MVVTKGIHGCLTSPMIGFDLKEKNPCALLNFACFLGPETGY